MSSFVGEQRSERVYAASIPRTPRSSRPSIRALGVPETRRFFALPVPSLVREPIATGSLERELARVTDLRGVFAPIRTADRRPLRARAPTVQSPRVRSRETTGDGTPRASAPNFRRRALPGRAPRRKETRAGLPAASRQTLFGGRGSHRSRRSRPLRRGPRLPSVLSADARITVCAVSRATKRNPRTRTGRPREEFGERIDFTHRESGLDTPPIAHSLRWRGSYKR